MSTRLFRTTAATGVLASVLGLAAAAPANAATGAKFKAAQTALETQLTSRTGRLASLANDVAGALSAKTLTGTDASILSARIGVEQLDIAGLTTAVPMAMNWAQLNADKTAMLAANRVYAVMSPQVFLTIQAGVVTTQAGLLAGNETILAGYVTSLVGLPGYKNAVNHDNNYIKRVTDATNTAANVAMTVLAQSPAGYPGNTSIFVNANKSVRQANISLAYADYDASVIALASGGYTGS